MNSRAHPQVFVSSFAPAGEGCIRAFAFDLATGGLNPLSKTTAISNPFFLALSPDRRFLYAIDAEEFGGSNQEYVAAFALEGRSGGLKFLNRQSTGGTASCHLDVDPDRKTLVVACYTTGNVASLPIHPDGSLGEAVSVIQHSGSSVDPRRQKKPHAHCFEVSPDGLHALAADLGTDQIRIYTIDSVTRKIAENPAQPAAVLAPGSGPRHLSFHPNRQHVYVINELSNTITVFAWRGEQGYLTLGQTIGTLPDGFGGTSLTADIQITPDGRHLFGTNRGHDSIASYHIAEDGQLRLLGIQPSGGAGPQNLLITPDGRWLLCANMLGGNVTVFSIECSTGALKPSCSVEVLRASCIVWAG